jgi:hypothetical protein
MGLRCRTGSSRYSQVSGPRTTAAWTANKGLPRRRGPLLSALCRSQAKPSYCRCFVAFVGGAFPLQHGAGQVRVLLSAPAPAQTMLQS